MTVNTESAKSKILDTDYAVEASRLAKNQILQQVGIAMLAQANATKDLVKLLQNAQTPKAFSDSHINNNFYATK